MKLAIRLILVCIFLLNASIASADFIDGNKLYRCWQLYSLPDNQVTKTEDMLDSVYYVAYVIGVSDSQNGASFIIPDNVAVG
jgi:hypothetical protein